MSAPAASPAAHLQLNSLRSCRTPTTSPIANRHRCPSAMRACACRLHTKDSPPTPDRLPSGRSVTPIFRGTANALGHQAGGIFVLAFAKEMDTRVHRAVPRHPGLPVARVAFNATIGDSPRPARHLVASVRTVARCDANELPLRERGQYAVEISIGISGMGFCPIRCARLCRGVCRCRSEAIATTLAQLGEQQHLMLSVAGSSPAR